MLPIFKAFVEGKAIQCNIADEDSPQWRDATNICFGSTPWRYRIKPNIKAKRYVYLQDNTYYLAFEYKNRLTYPEGTFAFVKWIDTDWVEYEI